MPNVDNNVKIDQHIIAFATGNLTNNGLQLFKTLEYVTDRQARLDNPVFEEFRDNYINETTKFSCLNRILINT